MSSNLFIFLQISHTPIYLSHEEAEKFLNKEDWEKLMLIDVLY